MVKQGRTYKIVSDHLGSPRVVIDVDSGEKVQVLEYDEFGRLLSDSHPGFQPFGFAGGLYDADRGLVRFGARDYDLKTGRWTAKDPSLFGGGSTNLYGYSVNDPINAVDLDGHEPVTLTAVAVAGGVGFALGAGAYMLEHHGEDGAVGKAAIAGGIGAVAGVGGVVAGAAVAGAWASSLLAGGINTVGNVATQYLTTSEGKPGPAIIAGIVGVGGGMVGYAAGTHAFFSFPMIGQPIGLDGARRAGQVAGALWGGTLGGVAEPLVDKACGQ